ncbi:hypothetical protein ES708_30312 [subsurface metagenome]
MIITYDMPVYTALSGTSEVLLGGVAFTLPEWCRSIRTITPLVQVPGLTEGESVVCYLKVTSDDVVTTPLELLCNPVQPALISVTAGGEVSIPPVSVPIRHAVNIPVRGGERINLYGVGLIDHTIEPMMSVLLELSDAPPAGPRIRSRVSALETSGVVNVEVAGTPLDLKDINEILEIQTLLVGAAVPVVLEGAAGQVRMSSSEFVLPAPLKVPLEAISGSIVGATSIQSPVSILSKARVSVRCMSPCRLAIYSTLHDAMTTATRWAVAIKYV